MALLKTFAVSALLLCSLWPIIESLPAVNSEEHHLQKRSGDTELSILGDFTATEPGVLNYDGVSLQSCKDLKDAGFDKSGIYTINPGAKGDFNVFCDMRLLGGGWTVIQRRVDDSISFDKTWEEYKIGFGPFKENIWLGLEKIKAVTDAGTHEVYIGLQSYSSYFTFAWARYTSFSLSDEANNYKLNLGKYHSESTAGDSLASHDGAYFSTKDKDNDKSSKHCAQVLSSGWWYDKCHDAHLNGIYYSYPGSIGKPSVHDGITWQAWRGNANSLKRVVIAVRAI